MLGQCHQQVVGIAQTVCIGDKGSHVVQRHSPDLLAIPSCVVYQHEAPVH